MIYLLELCYLLGEKDFVENFIIGMIGICGKNFMIGLRCLVCFIEN